MLLLATPPPKYRYRYILIIANAIPVLNFYFRFLLSISIFDFYFRYLRSISILDFYFRFLFSWRYRTRRTNVVHVIAVNAAIIISSITAKASVASGNVAFGTVVGQGLT